MGEVLCSPFFAALNISATMRSDVAQSCFLKPVRGHYGKIMQRIEATLVAVGEEWCTVELENGEHRAAPVEDVKLVKAAHT